MHIVFIPINIVHYSFEIEYNLNTPEDMCD